MSSREKILNAIRAAKPASKQVPDIPESIRFPIAGPLEKFAEIFTAIGGRLIPVYNENSLKETILETYQGADDIVSVSSKVRFAVPPSKAGEDPRLLKDLNVVVMDALFGVAENGAVWVTEGQYKIRALPFICTHLAVVLHQQDLVTDMHAAYERMNADPYGFGLFIAGPSKTADIEQSLVLGAHGPKSMTLFMLH